MCPCMSPQTLTIGRAAQSAHVALALSALHCAAQLISGYCSLISLWCACCAPYRLQTTDARTTVWSVRICVVATRDFAPARRQSWRNHSGQLVAAQKAFPACAAVSNPHRLSTSFRLRASASSFSVGSHLRPLFFLFFPLCSASSLTTPLFFFFLLFELTSSNLQCVFFLSPQALHSPMWWSRNRSLIL
jgi:hypothetical protein